MPGCPVLVLGRSAHVQHASVSLSFFAQVAVACFCLVTFTSMLAPLLTLGLSLCRMETAGAPPTMMVLVDLIGTFLVCQLVRLLLHSRMVDHDDMAKGYVWTFEQWEDGLIER